MKSSRRASVRWILFSLLAAVLINTANTASAPSAADVLARELFGPAINAITLDAKITGPAGAVSQYSSKESQVKTGSKSGVVFTTGGSGFPSAPGDDLLSELIGKPTAGAATLTVQFRPTTPRKTVRLKVTLVSEEKPERLQQGFDDVFAASLDGQLIAFVRAADTKEPTDEQKAENPQAPRTVSLSEPIALSNANLHLLKLSIASVGDGNGPSTAIVSFDAEPEPDIFPPVFSTAFPITTPEPPGVVDPPDQPDDPELPKKALLPPWTPFVSAPPTPPTIIEGEYPVPVPDRSSSLGALVMGCISLALLSNRKRRLASF
jgi:hypothetical protein